MMAALLILAAFVVSVPLIGVVCQMFGGGYWALFHWFNGTFEVLGEVLVGIVEAIGKANE